MLSISEQPGRRELVARNLKIDDEAVKERPAGAAKKSTRGVVASPIGRDALLDAAIKQFSQAGYDSTSMRDIAAVAGMLVGSIYYYFPTKEKLFLAAHEHAIDHICARVVGAIDRDADPWIQLTQAAQGYLDSMLNEFEYASIVIMEFPRRRTGELCEFVLKDRRRFEGIFSEIVGKLPLRRGVDRSYFRLAILGMLAWSYTWYKPDGKDSPQVIARKMVALLKESTMSSA